VNLQAVGGEVVVGDEVVGELENGRYLLPAAKLGEINFVKGCG